jgi:hypothetical protein
MNKEKKQQLSQIKVQSFVTCLERDEQKVIDGGSEVPQPGGTSNPIFCRG